MKAVWNGEVIADSVRTQVVDGYVYFPRDSVRMDLLSKAEKTPSDHECPHGVQFYDVRHGSLHSERAAWSYEKPRAAMQKVDQWVSFWGDVEIKE